MFAAYLIFTIIATIATIGPVFKIRKFLARLFYVPLLGWIFSLGYGLGVSWVMLTIFSFKSSLAGLANLTSSIIFSLWLYYEHKKIVAKKESLA